MGLKARDTDHEPDLVAQADKTSEIFLETNLQNARALAAPESHPDFDGVHCVEPTCNVRIATARLKLGRIRCITCQEILEKQSSRFSRRT